MSDNNRKNLQEEKQNHEQHDFVEEFTQIFNSNTQNRNQNSHHTHSSLESDYSIPQTPFQNDDLDLPFLEDNFENNSVGDLPFDSQDEQWNLQSNVNNPTSMDTAAPAPNHSEKNSSFSEGMHSYSPHNDEEQILEALSPLPIQKNEGLQDKTAPTNIDPFFETDDFNANLENFFLDEIDEQNKNTVTKKAYEETEAFLQTNAQQPITNNTQSNYDDKQSAYHTPVNSPYETQANQQNLGNNHYDGGFLKQEDETAKIAEYKDAQTQYSQNNINTTEDISHQNSTSEIWNNQNNLSDTQALSEPFNTTQTENFFVDEHSHNNNPPPEVDTYKFADEIVEKTEPIMASKILYEAPKHDVPTDGLQKEFSEVFNVGNVSSEDFLQQHQDDFFNEIFHHTKQDPEESSPLNTLQQSANHSSVENKEQPFPPPSNSSQHKSADEVPTHVLATAYSRNFIRKSFIRGVILFALIAISIFSYFRFISPSENESPLIIHADNTPFKVKPETTETENNVTHDLKIYNQKNSKDETQESAQQPLVDSSETPENLTVLNEKAPENEEAPENTSSASSHDEPNIEDAITEALDHTVPTREVQTVIVKADGTMVLAPAHQTNEKPADQSTEPTNQSEAINQSVDQPQDDSVDSVQSPDINNNQAEDDTATNIDTIIAESASIPDDGNFFTPDESPSIPNSEKKTKASFIPVPLSVKPNPTAQTHSDDRSNLPAQVTTQNSENYYVQLASHPTSELAENSLRKLKSKFGSLIGERPFNIQSTSIPEKGTYYRVRIQTQNRNEAINLCENIKISGGNCFVTR
ncbi:MULTISPECIES: SPOR domain-containing protein [Bartonella]|uniref:Tfp pilus assembly major pilin PilA n=1 Tax=Bartonella chomelii TaxID=236402 RepID=A0ABR6E0U2_9HYPH|nr:MULTISPECIES: SPOR domain-containing protein [Bartonella]MBA9082187.1 Tfp pilus assembly major pilin PilA [Bartonella chomelii]